MSFEQIRHTVEALLPEILARIGAFPVEVSVKHDGRGKLVRVLIDTDAGIKIDECAEVSRELGRHLDASGVIESSYRLEVSSPGIDQPLKLLRQYAKNIGRRYKVTYRGAQETETASAVLEGLEGDVIRFRLETGEPLELPFDSIIESREILPW
jgi:ribosome maturation factor RimP